MIISNLNEMPVEDLEILCNALKFQLVINDGKIVGTERREL